MARVLPERREVNGQGAMQELLQATRESIQRVMCQWLNAWLVTAVEHLLGREAYQRRRAVKADIAGGVCARCHSHSSCRFSRNGSRPRVLNLLQQELHLRLPRVVCQCGGSVHLDFGGLLRPYQRLGEEVDERIRRWAALNLSLRQMQQELHTLHIGGLGLRTLQVRLHQLQDLTPTLDATDTPPVLQIDAIWISQLRKNGQMRLDAKGRQRAVKGRFKRPVLIAMGVWPDTGRSQILAFELAEDESALAWLAFLSRLEAQGICGEKGLELIIHDGGAGLCAALQTVHFDAEQQRCLFHKLRNIAKALKLADDLTAEERTRQRKAILKDFQAIWQAKHYATALRRYLQVVRQYRHSQPQAVAVLQRDFRATLTYYHLEPRHPDWSRQSLRTTSRLERFNRTLRRCTHRAGAYHSDVGLLAMVAQQADLFRASQSQHECLS